jgi:hypothetical protein
LDISLTFAFSLRDAFSFLGIAPLLVRSTFETNTSGMACRFIELLIGLAAFTSLAFA